MEWSKSSISVSLYRGRGEYSIVVRYLSGTRIGSWNTVATKWLGCRSTLEDYPELSSNRLHRSRKALGRLAAVANRG